VTGMITGGVAGGVPGVPIVGVPGVIGGANTDVDVRVRVGVGPMGDGPLGLG
jgi:hypothetical protein